MSETMQCILGCVSAVLILALLVVGPVACSVQLGREATKRVAEVCAGDLKTDPVRATACIMAVNDAKSAGRF